MAEIERENTQEIQQENLLGREAEDEIAKLERQYRETVEQENR